MVPFIQVSGGDQYLTYADSIEDARVAFVAGELLSNDDRIRQQPPRKASAFIYTNTVGENVAAFVVGAIPPEFQDDPE